MVKLLHPLTISTALMSSVLPSSSGCNSYKDVAQIKLTIPKYSEWINGTDSSDFERGKTDIHYGFSSEDIENDKKFEFVWTTLEHVDVPKTFFPTPYWNMTCKVSAGQAFEGTASFSLSEEEPWITVDEAKPWAGISCKGPKCLASACKQEKQPIIDTFLP